MSKIHHTFNKHLVYEELSMSEQAESESEASELEIWLGVGGKN